MDEAESKLQRLQKVEFELLRDVDQLCKLHQVDYWLACGTLLGAVRHKDFIPWDDDVDIFMTRDNYEKFLSIPAEAIPDTMHIRTYMNTSASDSNISFQTKIESTRKKVVRKIGHKKVELMIWIDIFIIDGMPKSRLKRKLHYINLIFHQTLFRIARSYRYGELKEKKRGALERLGVKIEHLIPIGKMLDIQRAMSRTEKLFSKYRFDTSDKVIAYVPLYRKKCIVDRCIFEGKRNVLFHGKSFPIPPGAESYLATTYGDYMKMPPVEQRIPSHCEDVIELTGIMSEEDE